MHPLSSEEKKVRIVQLGNFVRKVGSNLRQKKPCNYKTNIAVLLSAALLFPPQFLLPMCCPHPIFWPNLMYAVICLFHSFLFSHFSFRKPISVWMIWQSQAKGAKWWIFRPPTKLRHLKLCYRYVYLHYLVPIIFPELCRMSRYSMHTQRGWREASHWINVRIDGKNL